MAFRLSPQQLAFCETFGYLHLPGVLKDRIGPITDAFEAVFAQHGGGHGGKPHDGQLRSCIVPFIDQHEDLCALLDDERVDGAISSLLGEDYQYIGSDGNYYVGDTPWHSDGPWPRPVRHFKLAMYLDPVDRETGALRIIPGSHHYGDPFGESLQQQIWRPEEQWGVAGRDVPCVSLDSTPGDVVIFHQGCKHASYGGSARRRMFTINTMQYHTPEQLHLIRDEISGMARFHIDSVYGETMLRTAGPARMKHLEQVLANQDHLPALTAKLRAEQAEPARG